MNAPHVDALIYRVSHRDDVDYAGATALDHEGPGFRIHIAAGAARIEPTEHYSTAEEARAVVEPFLRAWELSAAIEGGTGAFLFGYDRAEVVDRDPIPGVLHAAAGHITILGMDPKIHVSRAKYPSPPSGIARDEIVDLMFTQYSMYRDRRITLAPAAYFCLTALEYAAENRRTAADRFGIDFQVLAKLGDLSSTKGGSEARKFKGARAEFTPQERRWIEALLLMIIRRAAEIAHDETARRPQITMADLPPLENP